MGGISPGGMPSAAAADWPPPNQPARPPTNAIAAMSSNTPTAIRVPRRRELVLLRIGVELDIVIPLKSRFGV
jgi:hypothetical protein